MGRIKYIRLRDTLLHRHGFLQCKIDFIHVFKQTVNGKYLICLIHIKIDTIGYALILGVC